jgi:hypothetical protein
MTTRELPTRKRPHPKKKKKKKPMGCISKLRSVLQNCPRKENNVRPKQWLSTFMCPSTASTPTFISSGSRINKLRRDKRKQKRKERKKEEEKKEERRKHKHQKYIGSFHQSQP